MVSRCRGPREGYGAGRGGGGGDESQVCRLPRITVLVPVPKTPFPPHLPFYCHTRPRFCSLTSSKEEIQIQSLQELFWQEEEERAGGCPGREEAKAKLVQRQY